MKPNYWLSRRPKYNMEEIFRIAQHYILNTKFHESLTSLRLAAALGHEEARFLNMHFEMYGASRNRENHMPILDFAHQSFSKNEHPRAIKYAWWFCDDRNETVILSMAEGGCALSQHMMGQLCKTRQDYGGATAWFSRAADQNLTWAIYELSRVLRRFPNSSARHDTVESDALLLKAADLSYSRAIDRLLDPFGWHGEMGLSEVVRDTLQARLNVSRQTAKSLVLKHMLCVIENFPGRENRIMRSFAVGREIADCDKYHPSFNNDFLTIIGPVVTIYRQMTSKARQAAVQTVLALRVLGVVKDVAVLIAKVVYASRSEMVWYNDN